jgi:hypothetical protein
VALSDCERAAVEKAYSSAVASKSYTSWIYMMTDIYEYFACALEGWFQVGGHCMRTRGVVPDRRALHAQGTPRSVCGTGAADLQLT